MEIKHGSSEEPRNIKVVSIELAKIVGLMPSALFMDIHYRASRPYVEEDKNGLKFVNTKIRYLVSRFPCSSIGPMHKYLKVLVDFGFIHLKGSRAAPNYENRYVKKAGIRKCDNDFMRKKNVTGGDIRRIDTEIAEKYGLGVSMLIGQFRYWYSIKEDKTEGEWHTYDELIESLPFWCLESVKNYIKKAIEIGLLGKLPEYTTNQKGKRVFTYWLPEYFSEGLNQSIDRVKKSEHGLQKSEHGLQKSEHGLQKSERSIYIKNPTRIQQESLQTPRSVFSPNPSGNTRWPESASGLENLEGKKDIKNSTYKNRGTSSKKPKISREDALKTEEWYADLSEHDKKVVDNYCDTAVAVAIERGRTIKSHSGFIFGTKNNIRLGKAGLKIMSKKERDDLLYMQEKSNTGMGKCSKTTAQEECEAEYEREMEQLYAAGEIY